MNPKHAQRPTKEEFRQAIEQLADHNGNNTIIYDWQETTTTSALSPSAFINNSQTQTVVAKKATSLTSTMPITSSSTSSSSGTRTHGNRIHRINLNQQLPKPSQVAALEHQYSQSQQQQQQRPQNVQRQTNDNLDDDYLALYHHKSENASTSSSLPPPPSNSSPKRNNGTPPRTIDNCHLIDWRTPSNPADGEEEWRRKVETITEKYNQPIYANQQHRYSIIPLANTCQAELLNGFHFVQNQLYANINQPNVSSSSSSSSQMMGSPLHAAMIPLPLRMPGMVPTGYTIASPMSPTMPYVMSTSSAMLASPLRSIGIQPFFQNNVPNNGRTPEQISELLNKITTNVINRQASTTTDVIDSNQLPSSARRNSIGHCESLNSNEQILQPTSLFENNGQRLSLVPLDIVSEFDPLVQLGCTPDSPPPTYDSVVGGEASQQKLSMGKHEYANLSIDKDKINIEDEPESSKVIEHQPTSQSAEICGNEEFSGFSCLRITERPLTKFNAELQHFCEHLKALYISTTSKDSLINLGLVFSPRIDLNLYEPKTGEENKAIFIVRYHSIVWTKLLEQSAKKTSSATPPKQWDFIKINCDISSKVDLLIYNVLNNMPALDDEVVDRLDVADYLLKISDRNEYFVPSTSLDSYVYIHQCKKMNMDITLELVDRTLKELWRPFQRSKTDVDFIQHNLAVEHLLPVEAVDHFIAISSVEMFRLIDEFDVAFTRFLSFLPDVAFLRKEREHFNIILTKIRAIVAVLSDIETIELTNAIEYMKAIYQADVVDRVEIEGSDLVEKFTIAHGRITKAIGEVVQIYSKAFPVNFCLDSSAREVTNSTGTLRSSSSKASRRTATTSELKNLTTLHIGVVTQLPDEWTVLYQQFALRIIAYHGGNVLDAKYTLKPKPVSNRRVVFNEEIALDRIFICDLPRETRLECILIGFRGPLTVGGGGTAEGLANGHLFLFNYEEHLEQGMQLLPLTPLKPVINFGTVILNDNAMAEAIAMSSDKCPMTGWNYNPKAAMLVVRLPRYKDVDYVFPNVLKEEVTTPPASQSLASRQYISNKSFNLSSILPSPSIVRSDSKDSSSYYGLYGRNIEPLLRHSHGRELISIIQKNPLQTLSNSERVLVWDNRRLLVDFPGAILKILISPPSWSPTYLRMVIKDVINQYNDYPWSESDDRKSRSLSIISSSSSSSSSSSFSQMKKMLLPFNTPIEALQLLGEEYADTTIRQKAIHWLRKVSVDELCDYLPQLVQSLRYETYLYGSLIWLLFEQALISVRFCHYFYWHLKTNTGGVETAFGQRCQIYLNSLLLLCGQSVARMFQKQELLCAKLVRVCADVREAKESMKTSQLQFRLEEVKEFLETNPISIPLSPSMQVCGIDLSQCSYFNSNSLPLKIVFQSAPSYHLSSSDIFSPFKHLLPQLSALEQRRLYNKIIFKCGDDLRQDMLVMQIISIINRIWLRAGRDLRLITFGVMNNGDRTGMIELVGRARTLRQIQVEYGVTGNFKNHTIDTWLKRQNSDFDYRVAVENFIHSCAGYVVITYLLGICDRHNDNIMVTTTGHLFHIDFGKFLGDAQRMAGIKRDRTPFVFTTDMAYVINAGDKPSKNYHFFVDLCCECFSLVRQSGNFLLSLLAAMIPLGIGGLSAETIKYFHDALKPELSDSEAKEYFNRLIEKAHKSFSTQFNFLLHNLAQFRFTSGKDSGMANYGVVNYDGNGSGKTFSGSSQFEPCLDGEGADQLNSLDLAEQTGCDFSFTRIRSTRATDGPIDQFLIDNFWKKVDDSEKIYYYRIWIYRNGKPESRVYRSYREFVELSEKLATRFEKANIVALPRSPKLFRSQTREVAEARFFEIKTFLSHLWSLASEISHSDIVYTFFHQIQRDQVFIEEETDQLGHRTTVNQFNQLLYEPMSICGQIKLKISYLPSVGKLNIFVNFGKNIRMARGHEPDSYVKLYLLPDPNKTSKRKTRIITRSSFPTYMESISYEKVFDWKNRQLDVSIWEYDLSGNSCIGKAIIELSKFDLIKGSIEDWFPLHKTPPRS